MLHTPGIGAQQIIGENVGSIGVSIHDRKPRTAGTLDVFGPGFGTKLVVGVWFYWDELRDSCFRGTLPVEGDGERSCSAVELTGIDGQDHMGFRFVPPVKSTV